MAQGSGRKPLVADKRYPKSRSGKGAKPARRGARKGSSGGGIFGFLFGRRKPAAAPKKAAPRKKAAATRKPAPKRKRGLIGTLLAPFRWLLRLVWGFTWRVGLICTGIVALAVGYQYMKLPEVTQLLDGRARGSVTLLDAKGEVFAWRGDQFGGRE